MAWLILPDQLSHFSKISFLENIEPKTHRIVPLFMMKGQLFIPGQDLKKGLQELNQYYDKLPDETKAQWILKFASYPPRDKDLFISRLWDKLSSTWRKDADIDYSPSDEELLKRFDTLKKQRNHLHQQAKYHLMTLKYNFHSSNSATERKNGKFYQMEFKI